MRHAGPHGRPRRSRNASNPSGKLVRTDARRQADVFSQPTSDSSSQEGLRPLHGRIEGADLIRVAVRPDFTAQLRELLRRVDPR